jgi:hypothetical protein
MLDFGLLRDGVVFVVGFYWCRTMFRRWRSDLDELRTSRDVRDWVVIGALWGVTAFLMLFMIGTSVGLVRSLARI